MPYNCSCADAWAYDISSYQPLIRLNNNNFEQSSSKKKLDLPQNKREKNIGSFLCSNIGCDAHGHIHNSSKDKIIYIAIVRNVVVVCNDEWRCSMISIY